MEGILFFCGIKYDYKRTIEIEDIPLTSSAIVTTFLLEDLLRFFALVSKDFSFILTIIFITPIFLIIYLLNLYHVFIFIFMMSFIKFK
jgi:hypothetical protein